MAALSITRKSLLTQDPQGTTPLSEDEKTPVVQSARDIVQQAVETAKNSPLVYTVTLTTFACLERKKDFHPENLEFFYRRGLAHISYTLSSKK